MSEAANRLEVGRTLSAMAGNLAANPLHMGGLLLAAGIIGGLADTASPKAGNLVGNILLFFVGLYASYTALKNRCGGDPDIQPHGGRVFRINLLSGLGISLGLLLLIVPGLMLFTRWAVAVPAMMREDLGVMEALGRSRDLTKGSRWAILGLGLVIWVPVILLIVMFAGLTGAFAEDAGSGGLLANIVTNLLSGLATILSSTLWVESYATLSGNAVRKDELVEIFA